MLIRSLVGLSCALVACATPLSPGPASPSPSPMQPSPSSMPPPSPPPPPPAAADAGAPAQPTPPARPARKAPSRHLHLDGSNVQIAGLGFDAANALYVAGTFATRLQVESHTLRGAVTDARSQLFIARIHPHGRVDWLIRAGLPRPTSLSAMAVAPDGSVALAGSYQWATTADRGPAGPQQMDAFVILIGADGKVRWERRIDGTERQMATAVQFAADGALLVGGAFEDVTHFGPRHQLASVAGRHVASLDAFLARYTRAGDVDWVSTAGGSEDDRVSALTVGASGEVTLVGTIGRNAVFNDAARPLRLAGPPPQSNLANPDRLFVASYTPTGALRWATQHGTKDTALATHARALSDGSVLIHGWEQDVPGPLAPFLLQVDPRGAVLHRRTSDSLGALAVAPATAADAPDSPAAPAPSAISARVASISLAFERITGAATTPEAPSMLLSASAPTVSALAFGSDGRVAAAGTTGEPTRTPLSGSRTAISFESVDGYIVIGPSLAALRVR